MRLGRGHDSSHGKTALTADWSHGSIHPAPSPGRFDLRASLLICVYLRSNFLRLVRFGAA
jgi:hypothetical protein